MKHESQRQTLARYIDNARRVIAFLDEHGDKIPEDLYFSANHIGYPGIDFSIGMLPDGNREKFLAWIGDTFGRDAWTSEPDNHAGAFKWTKQYAGIRIVIDGAEKFPHMAPMPVPPTKFPIQIAEHSQQTA